MPEIRSVRVTDFSDVKAPVLDLSKAAKVPLSVSPESSAISARFKPSNFVVAAPNLEPPRLLDKSKTLLVPTSSVTNRLPVGPNVPNAVSMSNFDAQLSVIDEAALDSLSRRSGNDSTKNEQSKKVAESTSNVRPFGRRVEDNSENLANGGIQTSAQIAQVLSRRAQLKAPTLASPIPGAANLSDAEKLNRLSNLDRIQYVLSVTKEAIPAAVGDALQELSDPKNGLLAAGFVAAQWVPYLNAAVNSAATVFAVKSALDKIGTGVNGLSVATSKSAAPVDLSEAGQEIARSAAGAAVDTVKTAFGVSVVKKFTPVVRPDLNFPSEKSSRLKNRLDETAKEVRGGNFDVFSTGQFRALIKEYPGIVEVLRQISKLESGVLKGSEPRQQMSIIGKKNTFSVLPSYNKGNPITAQVEYLGRGEQSQAFKLTLTQQAGAATKPVVPIKPVVVKVAIRDVIPSYVDTVRIVDDVKSNRLAAAQMRKSKIRFSEPFFAINPSGARGSLPKSFDRPLFVGEFVDVKTAEAVLKGAKTIANRTPAQINLENSVRTDLGLPRIATDKKLNRFKVLVDDLLFASGLELNKQFLQLDLGGTNALRFKRPKEIVIIDPLTARPPPQIE
jgi:hypothetical protein